MLKLLLDLSGRGIDGFQKSEIRFGFFRREVRAAVEGVTGLVRLWGGAENVALVAGRDVDQSGLRIIGGWHEVRGAKRSGTDRVSFERGFCVLISDRPAISIFRVAPGRLSVGSRRDELAAGAIDYVEVSVAVGLGDQLLFIGIDQDWDLGRVPIMLVVLGELEVPVQLAGVGVEREQGIGVEVVAGASFAAIRRRGISGGPENLIRGGIVGPRIPCRCATDLPRIAFPGVVAGLSGTGNGVETPFALAGIGVVGIDESADAILSAGNADDDQVLHGEWRDGEAVAGSVVGGGDVPADGPGLGIERDDVSVERAEEDLVAEDGHAAIDVSAAGPNVAGNLALIHPDGASGAGVEGEGAIVLRGGVEDSVNDQRSGFELSGGGGLVNPLGDDVVRVGDIDLIERAEALSGVVAGVRHPVLRLFGGVEETVGGELGVGGSEEEES